MTLRQTALAAALAMMATSAIAGSFVELPTTPTLRKFGSQNLGADQLHIAEGAIIATDLDGFNTYGAPANLVLLDSRTTGVSLDGEDVGDFFDYVFRDTTDNKLVFGSRLVLDLEGAEVNDIFRNGFTGFSAAAAWTFKTDTDLRLYSAARSNTGLRQGADVFSADVIDLRSDINVQEGNPSTGLFLIKTDAPAYRLLADGARVYQAGEEGQPVTDFKFLAFAPTTAPVPEPSTYAMLLGGLGLLGAVARRRSK
ncbi:MAG: PEP-CTERM sorting domain-containing protein [Burkholderiales bacterium]